MSKSRIGKAGLASLAVTGLVSSGLLFTAGTANAVPGFEFDRIAGSDRFATSALVAEQIGDGPNAILANGQRGQFADALAANYLAGDLDAPVYLTRQNTTPDSILNQLEDNEVENITIVGGNGAVSAAQQAALTAEGYTVTRVSGANRFETNAEIINEVGDAPEETALVATGLNFADALAGGPLAENGHPLGLASQNGVSDAVLDALTDAGVTSAIVIGGEGAVGAGAVSDLEDAGIEVITRLSGSGRADTSVEVAEYGVANLGLTDTAVNLASGDAEGSGADALSGGVLTGQQGRPLLITQSVNNPSDAVRGYIEENSDTLTEGTIFGGDGAVSLATQAELEELGQGDGVEPPATGDITVTPTEDIQQQEDENRVYTASGLSADETYRITLVDTDNYTEGEDGSVTFDETTTPNDDPDGEVAGRGDIQSDITVVNGVPVAQPEDGTVATVGDISPNAAGEITFTVTADSTIEEYAPFVYVEGGDSTFLDVDENGVPTDEFGVGGSTQVVPEENETGEIEPGQFVEFVDKETDSFATLGLDDEGNFYNYDSNDNFFISDDFEEGDTPAPGDEVTFEEFEAALSPGDTLNGLFYQSNPALSSTFVLDNTSPGTPEIIAVDAEDTTATVTLDETFVDEDADLVTIYGEDEADDELDDEQVTTESPVLGTATEDADEDEVGFQVELTGLTPETEYVIAATQTVDDEESELSNEFGFETTVVQNPLTIDSSVLTLDVPLVGNASSGDSWTIEFSRAIAGDSIVDGVFDLTAANGALIRVACDGSGNDEPTLGEPDEDGNQEEIPPAAGAEFVTDATCAPGTGADTITVTLEEDAERRNAGGGTDGAVTYALTITAADGIDAADGAGSGEVNIADSDDVVIGPGQGS